MLFKRGSESNDSCMVSNEILTAKINSTSNRFLARFINHNLPSFKQLIRKEILNVFTVKKNPYFFKDIMI